MRRRSSTATRTRSVSNSATFALALPRNANRPTLETLPTEILLEIVQIASAALCGSKDSHGYRLGSNGGDSDSDNRNSAVKDGSVLDHCTLRALALTSRALAALAHAVLYRTVYLNELKPLELFARTTVACAHHDITLAAATSPLSPAPPTTQAFVQQVPASFLGKYTSRLVLDSPHSGKMGRAVTTARNAHVRRLLEEWDRFCTAAGALLGLGPPAPSIPSPILASLRTLIADSEILLYLMKNARTSAHYPVSPTPSEIILSTYLPAFAPSLSPLAPLAVHLTHLVIAQPPARWSSPSATLAALGGAPALTHLALVRKAHANEDNDLEFVDDVARIVAERAGALACVVLVVTSGAAFAAWSDERRDEPPTSDADASALKDLEHEAQVDAKTRALEEDLSTSHIWSRLAALARTACPDIVYRKGAPAICVVPGQGDAWARVLRNSSGPRTHFDSNVFLERPGSVARTRSSSDTRDFWSWAKAYEVGRRAREERRVSQHMDFS